jgi:Ca2+-binding RTX toxin-like protein
MKAKTLCSTFVVLTMLALTPLELSARTLGMVADHETISVTVFDADTHAILGTVPITPVGSADTGDVLITPDLKRGFVTITNNSFSVIDLTTSPPSLAGGTNPIFTSTQANDLSISPDGKFLVVSSFFSRQPISVVDIATQAEINTFFTGTDAFAVDTCSDGSVLAASIQENTVRRLTLSGTGILTDTGEVLSLTGRSPTNVFCAPGAQSGIVIELGDVGAQGTVTSFTIPGLSEVDTRPLSGVSDFGHNGTIHPSGNRVFVRSFSPGLIEVFSFNSATGALGASPMLTFPVGDTTSLGSIDDIALHPNGTKLFVSEFGVLNVYDPNTGALLASITDPNIVRPTGVTVQTEADPCALPPPPGAIVGTNGPDILNGTPGNDKIFGLGGSDQINGGGGNDLICGGAGDDQLGGGAGNDQIVGGSGIDQITGGAGNDILNTQDGVNGNDSANGGTGTDTCTGDPGDALSSCNP